MKGTEPPETADLSRDGSFVVSLTFDPVDPQHTPHTYDPVLVFVVTLAT